MPGAVEELMRWVPLLAVADVLPRYALEDVELSGGTVPAGDAVLLAKHAANRDPRRYDNPDRLEADLQWKSGMAVRGPVALPVAW
jgi:cytochrome P450